VAHSSKGPAPQQSAQQDPAEFGLYVHWPFCAAKCPYCDFNSHVRYQPIAEAEYCAALVAQIEGYRRELGARHVASIFFGGGTPSLMAPQTVAAIIDATARVWDLADDCEITLEANPTSVEATRFAGYRMAGVNRVSLGVQALNDADLRALGRLHSADEARDAIALARGNFDRVSFDLIYARSGQTLKHWEAELASALALAPEHLSLYQLTIEQGTPFAELHAAGKLPVPAGDLADEMYATTRQMTAAAGLPLYEISNHARPGQESRHNLLYWRYGEYVGIGPGAHGRPIVGGQRFATETERLPEVWLRRVQDHGTGETQRMPLTRAECADELLLMGLRLDEGVDLHRLRVVGGVQPSAETISDLITDGLIEPAGNHRLRATDAGRFLLNQLVLALSQSFQLSPDQPAPIQPSPVQPARDTGM